MSSGRGRANAGTVVLACVVLVTIGAGSASAGKPRVMFQKARVVSDGIVTPGQLETIAVSRMPPRARVRVFVEPPPTTPECGQFYFCDPVRTSPAPGYPPYRTSGKGRALLTFVMPSSYFVRRDPFLPEGRHVDFANGQAVHLDVDGSTRHKRKRLKRVGFGFARAVVQLPPS